MTTKNEALALALEALEEHDGNYAQSNASAARVNAAITAIKQAQEKGGNCEQQIRPQMDAVGGQQSMESAVSSGRNLVNNIAALLSLDAANALVPHGIGGHAKKLLEAASVRIVELERVASVFDTAMALAQQPKAQQAQEPIRFGSYEHAHPEDRWAASQMPDVAEGQCPHCGNFDPPTQQAQEPVEPVAWFAFADSNGPVPLELYGWDEKACKHAVLTNARSVGWKGTLDGYLYQQGWTIKPVYTHPAPKQAEPEGYK